ncbi:MULTISPECIES: M50 family metallopeptidase [Micromonospora]|uniref:M50 family metallopeptidase n=1 Tax=Micromonospora TaxID=1873 RepID=UPI0003EEAB7B|nr:MULTISPECIES: M50 family metallopeptidase [unclassified Micromonospora]EWM65977.1 integral membrane protein [Micromonospora sp. M42]MCK1807568.1 M50 family metallopeptidase [Micromonospora sp. R42106]MCK1832233.1 M50 family metallopeptidase [Micromonospora sp. R42003]MCK1844769.1 M50 family metallopeptidase [Micromonospora sp. R42004]MCM1018122.1 M50 family metallopeptidase [Micromonospora sp. XM-20-01]
MPLIDGLTTLWDTLMSAQPDPPPLLVVLTAVVALAVVATRLPWRIARNAVTIAHEGGHALVALLTGRRLHGIRLHSDTSGLTLSAGRPTGPGMILTLLAGYVAPSLLGLGGAWLLAGNRITLLLWLAVALLLAMLVMIRNLFGVLSLLVTGGVVLAVSWYTSPEVQAAFAWTSVWFLLLGGVRPVFELHRQRARGRMPQSDADQLARLTPFPALFWVGVFLLVSVGALVVGALLLAGPILADAGLTA